jgi:putative cardiolipin synthase
MQQQTATTMPSLGLRAALIAGLTSLAAACAGLEPVQQPPDFAPEPARATLWESIDGVRQDDWHVILNDGLTALDWRLTAIDSATTSIDLQTFLWTFDTAGAMVLDHLVSAADRGVAVRLLIDDSLLLGRDEVLLTLHRHPNIEYRIFNPYKRRVDDYAARTLLNLGEFSRLDHRMHNKAMVVDNRVAIVGGRNLADEYFGLHEAANFRDLEVLIGGPIVREVSEVFDEYWNNRWSVPVDAVADIETSPASLEAARMVREAHVHVHDEETAEARARRWLALATSGSDGTATLFADEPPKDHPGSEASAPVQVADELVRLFDESRSEVVIVSAYFIPTPELEGAVRRAVDRGVRVRILTNSIRSNNHLSAHSAYRNHINRMVEDGAELHEVRADARDRHAYMTRPVDQKILGLHAKALLFDRDRVFIGSVNLDPRSLRINTEMGLLVESRELNAELRAALDGDFHPANAWQLQPNGEGGVVWVSDAGTRTTQPADSVMQDLEDWFFSLLPIEDEL